MTLFTIRTGLWPSYGHYNSWQVSPLSLLAFHVQILSQHGNLIDAKNGQFFFRNAALPLPRAATFSAWRELVGLGDRGSSPFFYVPFLPSSRSDEESGIAASLRGAGEAGTSHLKTLTRKSKLHVRDKGGRISWGQIYVGRWDRPKAPLVMALDRSDVVESFVVPRRHQVVDIAARYDLNIRVRMEFLAQFGIPATTQSGIPIRSVRRLLFQVLERSYARDWAEAYANAKLDYESSIYAERQDYNQLIHEIGEKKPENKRFDSRKPRVDFELEDFELSL